MKPNQEQRVRCLECHWQGHSSEIKGDVGMGGFEICPACLRSTNGLGGPAIIQDDLLPAKRQIPEFEPWIIKAHSHREAGLVTRTCSPDDWGYRSGFHPFQVVIQAAGWKAKLLAFLFRIPPCNYTFSDVQYWPKPELSR